MAFLGGAECSTAGNPLSQFTKHMQDDKSLQRDRLVGRGPSGLQESMRSTGMAGGQDKMMEEFMQHSNQMPGSAASPFAMDHMRREMENIRQGPQRNGSPRWASEFEPGLEEHARMEAAFQTNRAGFNPTEFERFSHMPQSARTTSPISNSSSMNGMYRPTFGMGYGMGGNMGIGMIQQPFGGMNYPQQAEVTGKGKGRMVELDDKDWEAEFAQMEAERSQDLDALDDEANKAIEEELNDMNRSVLDGESPLGDFESIWRKIQAESAATGRQMEDAFRDPDMHAADFEHFQDFDGLSSMGNFRDPQLGNYLFEDENLFRGVGDPFGEGVRIMDEGGNLSLAALAFEAAVQKDPKHVEAWTRLGAAQAQNEKETPAIRALEQALKLDEHNLDALMGLAVSYTNEGYDSTAYKTLRRWVHTKYPNIDDPEHPAFDDPLSAELGITNRHQLHEQVTNLFIRAAQLAPSAEQMDPDVQVGLGVLFYGDEEYEKAVDCFTAALESTEQGSTNNPHQLPLLWNRLGATLANSGRSEEAIQAYERALKLNANFVRARYNLGVSCINIGCYAEAAQHLLGALAMHKVVEREGREKAREVVGDAGMGEEQLDMMINQNQSTNLYDTLRRVFGQMGRRDLSDKVVAGMDVDVFRGEFDF